MNLWIFVSNLAICKDFFLISLFGVLCIDVRCGVEIVPYDAKSPIFFTFQGNVLHRFRIACCRGC
uniref:Uncharacterized protein n=1 Tax=Arundo donax TaxID=35708 RepID=A0A0A9FAI5_ARUDO